MSAINERSAFSPSWIDAAAQSLQEGSIWPIEENSKCSPRLFIVWPIEENEKNFKRSPRLFIEPTPSNSVGLYGWSEIAKMREREEGNWGAKLVAEAGYFFNGLFSIGETGFRGVVSLAVDNPVSEGIAKITSLLRKNPEDQKRVLSEYRELCLKTNGDLIASAKAVAINFASLGPNLYSQTRCMEIAKAVDKELPNDTPYRIYDSIARLKEETKFTPPTSPVGIAFSAIGIAANFVRMAVEIDAYYQFST